MKQIAIFLLVVMASCSSNETGQKDSADATTTTQSNIDEQPAKTIIDFLKWYRTHQLLDSAIVKGGEGAGEYSMNFDEVEKYCSALLATHFVSATYIEKRHDFFDKCEKNFKANRAYEGPPEGFESDLIMLSQEYDVNLQNIEKSKVVSQSISDNVATIKIQFMQGNALTYKLTKYGDAWAIDDIAR